MRETRTEATVRRHIWTFRRWYKPKVTVLAKSNVVENQLKTTSKSSPQTLRSVDSCLHLKYCNVPTAHYRTAPNPDRFHWNHANAPATSYYIVNVHVSVQSNRVGKPLMLRRTNYLQRIMVTAVLICSNTACVTCVTEWWRSLCCTWRDRDVFFSFTL